MAPKVPAKPPKPPAKVVPNKKDTTTAPPSPIGPHHIVAALVISLLFAGCGTHFFAKAPINAVEFELPPPPPFAGPFQQNEVLAKAERILLDQVYGPESLAIHPTTGAIFSGLKTGLICEIEMKQGKASIVRAVQLSNFTDCDGSYNASPKCGRPLGLRFLQSGELLVADAYLGLFFVDLKKEKVTTLFRGGTDVSNDPTRPSRFLNDVDVLPDGRVVVSESSDRFDDRDYLLDLFEHRPNGRILIFDPSKEGELRVLLSGLYFPNGIQVIDDFVYFSEMGMARVRKVNWKTSEVSDVVTGLPGYPDNIRVDRSGHLLVPIAALRDSTDAWLAARPNLRTFITKVLSPRALSYLADFMSTPYGLVLRVDPVTEQVIESFHDTKGASVAAISIALETDDGDLLLGSDTNFFLGRLASKDWKPKPAKKQRLP